MYADDAEVVGIEPSFKIKNGETVHKKAPAQAAQTPYPSQQRQPVHGHPKHEYSKNQAAHYVDQGI